MTMAKKMLRAAIPSYELPKWFEATADSSDGRTSLALYWVVDGQTSKLERVLEKEDASVMDILELWPSVVDRVPAFAKGLLTYLPLPRKCTLKGAPGPSEEGVTNSKQPARLTFTATVAGHPFERHWDSTLDRLYMADLIEMFDWLKSIQKTNDSRGA
jgi:hypothetical protein